MIDVLFIQIFFIIVIVLFLIGMFIPMVIIKKNGYDPHGTHEGVSLLTRLTPITIFSWLIYIIMFIINGSIILHFLAFEFLVSDFFIITGIVIIFLGIILDIWGTVALGTNFRIELPKEETRIITTGIYRLMRNPIVMGIYLLIFGSFLIIPTIFSVIFLIVNVLTFNSKVKDEESFLAKRFGGKFGIYSQKVGRYLPIKMRKSKK